MKPFSQAYKRIFDFLLATGGVVLFLPLGLLFTFLIKREDEGEVFYLQERWGRGGKRFRAYKFRTMVDGADGKWGLKPAVENDERVTRIGKFLRVTAMDELPQLINIWKGDMSFVGPRALAVGEMDSSFPDFDKRHEIRPGLTGPAQIYLPRYASLEEKFHYDLDYIRNCTFFSDLKLLFISVWITLHRRWESPARKF